VAVVVAVQKCKVAVVFYFGGTCGGSCLSFPYENLVAVVVALNFKFGGTCFRHKKSTLKKVLYACGGLLLSLCCIKPFLTFCCCFFSK